MQIRVKIETVNTRVVFSKWEDASPEDLEYLQTIYREGLDKISALTLTTETGPLYLNANHIVAIQIEER